MKKGTQNSYPAHTGYHQQVHLMGALDWQTDTAHAMPIEHKHSGTFIAFVEWLCLDVYPDEPLVLVMDNVSYHRSAAVMAVLALLELCVQVLWLPKYSPDMNPIERYWLHLKNNVYANRLFSSLADLVNHIQLWLGIQNILDHPDRLGFAKPLSLHPLILSYQLTAMSLC